MKNILQDQRLLNIIFGTDKAPLIIHKDINEISYNEETFLVPTLKTSTVKGYVAHQYQYILNKDGTIRWIANKNSKKAFYLSFYNAQTLKAKCFVFATNVLFQLGLKNILFAGGFTVYIKKGVQFLVENHTSTITNTDHAFFLGTKGPNRKISVALANNNSITHFLKLGTGVISINTILMEQRGYQQWKDLGLKLFKLANIVPTKDISSLMTSNNRSKKAKRTAKLTKNHILALTELYDKTIQFANSNNYKTHIDIQLKDLEPDSRIVESSLMIKKIKNKYLSLNQNSLITTLVHGDFTPWNMFQNQDKTIAIYDLELTKKAPLFFDIFHFIYQNEVLVKRNNLSSILDTIKNVFEIPELKALVEKYNVNINEYHQWYLVENISYFLNYFKLQNTLHEQVKWLINVWDNALTHFENLPNQSNRKSFIKELFVQLKEQPYALMKSEETEIELPESSDLDILIQKAHSIHTVNWISNHPNIQKLKINKQSFMTNLNIYFNDKTFLSVDFIHEFKRKTISYINPAKILISAKDINGIKYSQYKFNFEYIAKFYLLNNAEIPVKYITQFNKLTSYERTQILQHLNITLGTNVSYLNELNIMKRAIKERLNKKINLKSSLIEKLKNNIMYTKDTIYKMLFNRGKVITFSGVDGVGKTTILTEIVDVLKTKYRQEVVVLRHRPSILPILSSFKYGKKQAENLAKKRLPRMGKNTSKVKSYIRFTYYYTDYALGQFYVFFKYSLRGKTIVYDRYYFDFIIDPKRSNLNIDSTVVKFLYRGVFKPCLNVLLYAPSNEVIRRKKELTKETIDTLTENYKSLFNTLKKVHKKQKYITIKNEKKQDTLDQIITLYTQLA